MSDIGSCWYTDVACAECGGKVATNGRATWCTDACLDEKMKKELTPEEKKDLAISVFKFNYGDKLNGNAS